MRVGGDVGHLGMRRTGDVHLGEPVPVLAGRFVRVVRVDERGDHEERLVLTGSLVRALPIAQVTQGPEDHLVVEVLLDVCLRRTRGEDRVGCVIPLEPVVEGPLPVGDHVEVGRVDVGRQPLLEAVVLVGPDEVHAADEGRVIAEGPQPVGEGRYRGGEVVAVVEAVDLRRQAAGHHRRPRRGAQRCRAVGAVEDGAGFCEFVDVRGQGGGVTVGAERLGRHLVGLDDDDVRGLHMLVTSLQEGATVVGRAGVYVGGVGNGIMLRSLADIADRGRPADADPSRGEYCGRRIHRRGGCAGPGTVPFRGRPARRSECTRSVRRHAHRQCRRQGHQQCPRHRRWCEAHRRPR